MIPQGHAVDHKMRAVLRNVQSPMPIWRIPSLLFSQWDLDTHRVDRLAMGLSCTPRHPSFVSQVDHRFADGWSQNAPRWR
jgi:hypothetical protein